MQTVEHFCSGCEARWVDHEWQVICPQCNSELVTNWPRDNEACNKAMDLARVWGMSDGKSETDTGTLSYESFLSRR